MVTAVEESLFCIICAWDGRCAVSENVQIDRAEVEREVGDARGQSKRVVKACRCRERFWGRRDGVWQCFSASETVTAQMVVLAQGRDGCRRWVVVLVWEQSEGADGDDDVCLGGKRWWAASQPGCVEGGAGRSNLGLELFSCCGCPPSLSMLPPCLQLCARHACTKHSTVCPTSLPRKRQARAADLRPFDN